MPGYANASSVSTGIDACVCKPYIVYTDEQQAIHTKQFVHSEGRTHTHTYTHLHTLISHMRTHTF